MSPLLTKLSVIPVLLLWTFANVLIASTMAGVVFLQLIVVDGWSKSASLIASVLTATAVIIYIWIQPKIRSYIQGATKL
jgi:hypothetical protein